jgi:hypothetical protein
VTHPENHLRKNVRLVATNLPGAFSSRSHRHRHDDAVGQFLLVILQGGNDNMGFSRVGEVYGLAVVSKGFLREPFGIPLWQLVRASTVAPIYFLVLGHAS